MPKQTINFTTSQATRVAKAFGKRLNLGRNATADEVKGQTIEFFKSVVWAQERREVVEAIDISRINPT